MSLPTVTSEKPNSISSSGPGETSRSGPRATRRAFIARGKPPARRSLPRRKEPFRRGEAPSRRPQSERQKLDVEALKLWSLLVRMRDGECRICGASTCTRSPDHAHHMVRVQFWGTRHDPENGRAMCQPCHWWIHHSNCSDEVALYRSLGVDWEALQMRKRAGGKGLDLKLVILDLRQQLAALEANP